MVCSHNYAEREACGRGDLQGADTGWHPQAYLRASNKHSNCGVDKAHNSGKADTLCKQRRAGVTEAAVV